MSACLLAPAGCGGGFSERGAPGLAVGLTEFNPDLYWSARSAHRVPPELAAARDAVTALRPRYLRLAVNWAAAQPVADRPPRWDEVRDQLRAIRSQRAATGGGWEPIVVLGYTPAWAAASPGGGCEPAGGSPESRAVAPAALPAYRAMVSSLLALGRDEGVPLRWWSPWNEPNAGTGITPERAACSPDAPLRAPATYVALARALRGALAAAPGDQRILLGEISSPRRPRRTIATVDEFVAALPDDLICGAAAWSQHEYVGDADGVGDAERALAGRRCGARLPIWVTETGVGGGRPGQPRPSDAPALRAQCRAMDDRLRAWWRDPRVAVALQYTYREDPNFPVGLADVGLGRRYPEYDLWRAWGARAPGAAPPRLPASCR